MIQDISVHFDNSYHPCLPEPDSRAFLFSEDRILLSYDEKNKQLIIPLCDQFKSASFQYLFKTDVAYFLAHEKQNEPAGFKYCSLREIRDLELERNDEIFLCYCAYHLHKGYQNNQYCGCCGNKTVPSEKERALCCPKCHNTIYPRLNPAVIVAIRNKDRLLLTKYKSGFAHNALVAGFVEFGETLEECVEREVYEETGLKVKNITYYKSQPWGIAQDILAGFYCDVDGDDTIRMDDNELKYAAWVERKDIVLQPGHFSLTNEMMEMFKNSRL